MIVGLLALAACVTSSISAKDYSAAETFMEGKLLDPTYGMGISSADVSINEQQVTFNCITDISVPETALEQFGMFLGGTLGLYSVIVNTMPEVGDLLIVIKNKNQPTVATLTCPKSWVEGIDLTNEDTANALIFDVFSTMKKA